MYVRIFRGRTAAGLAEINSCDLELAADFAGAETEPRRGSREPDFAEEEVIALDGVEGTPAEPDEERRGAGEVLRTPPLSVLGVAAEPVTTGGGTGTSVTVVAGGDGPDNTASPDRTDFFEDFFDMLKQLLKIAENC